MKLKLSLFFFFALTVHGFATPLITSGLDYYSYLDNETYVKNGSTQNFGEQGNVTFGTYAGRDAAYFDGSSYLYLGQTAPHHNGTLSLWFYGTSSSSGYMFDTRTNFRTHLSFQSNQINNENSLSPFTPNAWTHLAYAFETTNDTRKVYLNGVLVDTVIKPANISNLSSYGSQPFGRNSFIGSAVWDLPENYYTGWLDDITVYNRALSAAEVQSLYNSQLAAVPEPSTYALMALGALGLAAYRRKRK